MGTTRTHHITAEIESSTRGTMGLVTKTLAGTESTITEGKEEHSIAKTEENISFEMSFPGNY